MESVKSIMQNLEGGLSYIDNNKILSAVLGLFLALYAALAAPKLPKSVTLWFDNTWFKLGFMFLIAYMATKDASIAIISAVALLVTLQTLSAQRTTDAVVKAIEDKIERFTSVKASAQEADHVNEQEAEHIRNAIEEEKENQEVQGEVIGEMNFETVQAQAEAEAEVEPKPEVHAQAQAEAEVQGYVPAVAEAQAEAHAQAEAEAEVETPVTCLDNNKRVAAPVVCASSLDTLSGYDGGELSSF